MDNSKSQFKYGDRDCETHTVTGPSSEHEDEDGSPEPLPLQSETASIKDLHDQSGQDIDSHLDETPFHASQTPRVGSPTDVLPEQSLSGRLQPEQPSLSAKTIHTEPGSRKTTRNGFNALHKFSLYETNTKYYLVGGDITDQHFRMLKIDRLAPPGQLSIVEDEFIYSKREMTQLLNTIEDGNKAAGGMNHKCKGWGLLGFIRFTEAYYMLMVTKKEQVATIGGHFIYQVDGTELVPLTTGTTSRWQSNKSVEESRFLGILSNLDLHRSFYFSYSYNITRTLQHNIMKKREALVNPDLTSQPHDFNDMLVWNHHLLSPAIGALKNPYDWCLPIIHGFVDQSCVDIFGRAVYIALIARRSRFFAGARFLKRGSNDLGYVANDVETEQIVSDKLITSFHAPGLRAYQSPNYTSFVQHRGSIPLYWTQENTGVTPKPAIDLNMIDPFYAAAALHFDNLFERYGAPIYVLNLVKARERVPRESKLLIEYQNAIQYLNQSLPEEKRIRYKAYDMSRAAKTRGQDVIETLGKIAADIVSTTGFFRNGDDGSIQSSIQNGVVRSNCIDCLDRTNAAQFIVGKEALARQLQAMGIIAGGSLNYDSDITNLFAHMFNDHGDTLASQYGGSHLVNTMETYRKINNWSSHSRDMLESFKRFYHNSFLDTQRQEAYNLFLGNYIYASGQPMLWELPTDYYLHHADPKAWPETERRNYIKWFTAEYLAPSSLPRLKKVDDRSLVRMDMAAKQWWSEYYRPRVLSSFLKLYAYRMNSTIRYLPSKSTSGRIDLSPFCVRKQTQEVDDVEKKEPGKEFRPADIGSENLSSLQTPTGYPIGSLWFRLRHDGDSVSTRHARDSIPAKSVKSTNQFPQTNFKPADKTQVNQWTLSQFYINSLHPSVTESERHEYDRYINHPQNLPLVVHNGSLSENKNFAEYLSRSAAHAGFSPKSSVDTEALEDYLEMSDAPLLVTHDDNEKKRYQAYRKWLLGKSFFKQSKVDPEYRAADGRVA